MAYEIFFSYKSGAKSHYLQSDTRRVIKDRLRVMLAEESRKLAQSIIIKRAGIVVLDMPTSASDAEILASVSFPRVGAPSKILSPVTMSFYLPKIAVDFLKSRGNGSASKGLRNVLIEVGGDEIAQAYQSDK